MIWFKSNWEAQNLKSSSSAQVPKVPMNTKNHFNKLVKWIYKLMNQKKMILILDLKGQLHVYAQMHTHVCTRIHKDTFFLPYKGSEPCSLK